MSISRSRLFVGKLADDVASSKGPRVVEMRLSLRVADVAVQDGVHRWVASSEEELLEVGGRWDRLDKEWLPDEHGAAKRGCIVRFHRGQEQMARWFAEWARRFIAGDWEGFERAHSLFLVGGRRAGKTHGATAMAAVIAVAVPNSLVWAVSPALERSHELAEALAELLPRSWYRHREITTGKAEQFEFANGSKIVLRSSAKAEALRSGGCTLAILNEGQAQHQRAFTNLRGAVADAGSIVIVTANPPNEPRGEWVETLWKGIAERKVQGAGFHLTGARNPFVDFESLRAMESEVDERTALRDVHGMLGLPIADTVLHAWRAENVRAPGRELVDITAEVTRRELGRPAGYVVGVDLQRTPACVAAVFKVFRDPALPDEEIAFVLDEFEGTDEDDLLQEIEARPRWQPSGRVEGDTYRGWRDGGDIEPVHCAAVIDASSAWQDAEHRPGRTSEQRFLARRWREIYPPQKDSTKNPDIVARFKVANARLCSATGVRRMFVDPACVATIEALRLYPNKNGAPDRRHKFAHRADAVSYVAFRLWGRVVIAAERRGKLEYRGLGRFKDRADMFGGGVNLRSWARGRG